MAIIFLAALLSSAPLALGAAVSARQDDVVWQDRSLSPAQRAASLLTELKWDEKVAQMGGVRQLLGANATFNRTNYDTLYPLQHGILSYGNQLNSAQDVLPVANMVRQEQLNNSKVPWISITDSVNSIYVTGGTIFPATLSLSTSWDLSLYEQVVAAIRDENVALGTNWVLSPELDVAREPRYGRVGEMYGEDVYLIGEFASQYVRTMQERDENGFIKVACTVKHFLYGENSGGINTASMYGGVNHLWNDLAAPYVRAIQEDPVSIMVSYASIDRVPDHMNTKLLRGMLRDEMGFEGLLMSDAMGILHLHTQSKVANSYADAALKALSAGVQLELAPVQPACFPELANYANDSMVRALVDEAARHILEIKFATGMFDLPLPTMEHLNQTLRAEKHLEVNKQASREGIVLLENDGVLPLSGNQSLAVIGPFADLINPGSYAPVSVPNARDGVTLLGALEAEYGSANVRYVQGTAVNNKSDTAGIDTAVQAAHDSDVAILALGSLSIYFGNALQDQRTDGEFYTHADLGFPGAQQELLDAVLATDTPTILVLSGGQSFVLNNSTMQSNAILHSFLGGEYTGPALVEILTGKVNPSGKLTITMPQAEGAFPAYYDYLPSDAQGGYANNDVCTSDAWTLPCLNRSGAPHAFGYGLSYTTFDLSDETVSSNNGSLEVSCTVTNTGSVSGKEVVQVYFRPMYSIIEFPVKKLVRFAKVELAPNATTTVHFSIPHGDLGYWVDGKKHVGYGDYTVWVGTSSKDQDLRNMTVVV